MKKTRKIQINLVLNVSYDPIQSEYSHFMCLLTNKQKLKDT